LVSIEKLRARAISISLLIVAIGGLGWFLVVSDKDGSLFGENLQRGSLETVSFATLVPNANSYLICPKDLCRGATDGEAAVYDVGVAGLSRALFAYTDRHEGITMRKRDLMNWQFDLSEYATGENFPDVITVKFIPIGEDKSTVAIYSRSVIGSSDKAQQKERVDRWFRFIEAAL